MYLEDLFGLKGKVAVVTGGARGTGKVVAQGLAKAGAKVAVLCRSGADETVSLIKKEGGEAVSIVTDVSVEDQVKAAYSQILDRWGSLDIVFNNAAIGDHKSSLEVTVEEFRKVVDVNLTGEFIVAREAARIMVERGIKGSIINMASMSGSVVNIPQWQCSYNASKAGIIHMTKSLAVEFAEYGIRVNCLSPGYIGTEPNKRTPKDMMDVWLRMTPMKRMAEPEEMVSAVLYFASGASGYTTGSELIVDGGYSCI